MTDVAALYAEGRGRVTALVEGLSDEDAKAPVPTCPEWSVHDVLAHVTGVCADVLSGNIGGVASDSWTDAQAAARRDHSVQQIVAEWNEIAPQVESFANNFPGLGIFVLSDGNSQDQIVLIPPRVIGVPAPPGALLAGFGLIALVGRGRWSRRTPAPT